MSESVLVDAIGCIIGLAIFFFITGLLCYCLCIYLLRDETKDPTKPTIEAWDAKHYYDPLPSVMSPPEVLSQPSVYSFKIQNGTTPFAQPHAVINPAVLQYPPVPPAHVVLVKEDKPQQKLPYTFSKSSSKVSPKSESDKYPLVSELKEMALKGNGQIGFGHGHGGGGGKGKKWLP